MAAMTSPNPNGRNSMFHKVRTGILALAALGAIAVGASAISSAATNSGTTGSTGATGQQGQSAPAAPPRDPATLSHGPNETLLTDGTANRVKQAALDKVSGATVIRVETDSQGSPYEAHLRKSDGSEVTVKVDKDFKATAVQAGFGGPPGGTAGGPSGTPPGASSY
jgi:hypothetical protein